MLSVMFVFVGVLGVFLYFVLSFLNLKSFVVCGVFLGGGMCSAGGMEAMEEDVEVKETRGVEEEDTAGGGGKGG